MTDPFAVPAGSPPVSRPVTEPPAFGDPLPVVRRNGMGTTALILGIASIPLCFLVVLGPLAVVFGLVGRARVRRRQADNGGAALAGVILGVVGVALSALLIAALVQLFQSPEFDRFRACDRAASTTEQQNACAQDLVDEYLKR